MKKYWWDEAYAFFGNFYMEGDDSKEGYLAGRQLSVQERTLEDVDGVIRLLGLRKGARVLDIPCGYGRHSVELAQRGYQLVGSDINSTHLSCAISAAGKKNLSVDFRKENMLAINYLNEFDAVINMCLSFGFFETDDKNTTVLQNFYTALRPGGKFLMHTDVNLPRIYSKIYKEHESRTLYSGNILKVDDCYDPESKRLIGSWTIIHPDNTQIKKEYSVRVYEKDEFVAMCLEAGFKECIAYSNWSGDQYSEESEEIMFVATK